ncbi:MAG: hypothetical protein WC759_03255 [Candidatus Micrarchaeia archaeon]|jgi:hypothetical protein
MALSRVGIGTLPVERARIQPAQALQGRLQQGELVLDARSLARAEALKLLQDLKYKRAVETLVKECGSTKKAFVELADMFLEIAGKRPLQNPNYGMNEAMGEAYGMWSKARNSNRKGFVALCDALQGNINKALRITQQYYGRYGLANALRIAFMPGRNERKALGIEGQTVVPAVYTKEGIFKAAVWEFGFEKVMDAGKGGHNSEAQAVAIREILPGYVVRNFTSAGADWRGIENSVEGLYRDRDGAGCFENALIAVRKHFGHEKEEDSGPAAFNATMHLLGKGEEGRQKARDAALPAAMRMRGKDVEAAQKLVADWEREAKSRYTWYGEWN